jgi:tRNA pseudouridine55 synthase
MSARTSADGVLLLDKPAGITSTRALATAKRALNASKAGHTGTLDPFATGLLPLVFGEATKFSRFLIDATKGYEATLFLGAETESGDTETEPRHFSDVMPCLQEIADVVHAFTGDQTQLPPMHSAVHVGGRRLYEYAREGVEISRERRAIRIHALEILRFSAPVLVLSIACSKGTYVRVLAADIGRALGCGAYLTGLRRTAVGGFRLAEARTLDSLLAEGVEQARAHLLPVDTLVTGLAREVLDDESARRFTQGQVLARDTALQATAAVFGQNGRFLGVGNLDAGCLTPLRLMATGGEMA